MCSGSEEEEEIIGNCEWIMWKVIAVKNSSDGLECKGGRGTTSRNCKNMKVLGRTGNSEKMVGICEEGTYNL